MTISVYNPLTGQGSPSTGKRGVSASEVNARRMAIAAQRDPTGSFGNQPNHEGLTLGGPPVVVTSTPAPQPQPQPQPVTRPELFQPQVQPVQGDMPQKLVPATAAASEVTPQQAAAAEVETATTDYVPAPINTFGGTAVADAATTQAENQSTGNPLWMALLSAGVFFL